MPATQSQYKVVMTPETAQQWLSDYKYEYQRKPSRESVDEYVKAMQNGEWEDNGETIIVATTDGGRVRKLVDGQQRLTAITIAGVKLPMAVNEVACQDEAEIARVYYTINRNRKRTHADAYRTTHIADELGVSSTWINSAGAAVQFIHAGFSRYANVPQLSTRGRLNLLREYGPAIEQYVESMSVLPRYLAHGMQRTPTMSVGMVTFRYACTVYGFDVVEQFWRGLVEDDGLRRGDPRKKARTHIMTATITNNRFMSPRNNVYSVNGSARYIAQCFNYWTTGRRFSDDRETGPQIDDANGPIKINGTPWKG